MPNTSSDRNPVERLAEEFVARHRRGEHPDLSEYTAKYPQWADQIRDLFPALLVMEQFKPGEEDTTGLYREGAGAAEGRKLERLGDFRILREVGRGGMGIVYEAEQESLGRHVALKVLPAHALLDPRQLQRFRREAKAAARLHHTNIVPVYGVGESDNLHYYVMQFIQGLGLDQVLAELKRLRRVKGPGAAGPGDAPTAAPGAALSAAEVAQSLLTGRFQPPRPAGDRPPDTPVREGLPPGLASAPTLVADASSVHLPGPSGNSSLTDSGRHYYQSVARVGLQVAEALAYAHGQGTLHRDIKPSNLLLDTQGTVWVTDFGLAKAMEDADNLTQPGDIVGTLRYMAPERFLGRSDARADIYGLGLTLYELLALRPPFDEADRNGLIHQITHAEPPPLRRFDPNVPRDLETVVLKAVAKEPSHRYANAAEMADDLRRFIEDKPIQARRANPLERFWRWCRRNPAVASLSAAAVLLLVTVAVVATVAYVQAAAALEAQQGAENARQAMRHAQEEEAKAQRGAAEAGRKARAERTRAEEARQKYRGYFSDLARNYLDRGLALNQKGQVDQGMLWLARSLQFVPEDEEALRDVIRANLGQWRSRLPAHTLLPEAWVAAAVFSPDGKTVLTASNQDAQRWDVATGKPVGPALRQPGGSVWSVAYSRDGRTVLTGNGQQAQLWDAASGTPLGDPVRFPVNTYQVLYSPDARTALRTGSNPTGGVNETQFWDLATGKPIGAPLPVPGFTYANHFSPDGKYLLAVFNQTARLYDPATGAAVGQPLPGVMHASFGDDGKTLLAVRYNPGRGRYEVEVLDLATRAAIGKVIPVYANLLALSPDRRRLAANYGTQVQLWDPATGTAVGDPLQHRGQVMSAAFSPDGRLLLTLGNEEARLWDAATGTPLGEPLRPQGQLRSASFSPDGRHLLTTSWWNRPGQSQLGINQPGSAGAAQLWRLEARLGRPLVHPAAVRAVAVGKTGLVLTGGADGVARLWDPATGKPAGGPFVHKLSVTAVAFSPDARRVLTASADGTARVWDAATGQPVGQPLRHGKVVWDAAFSPNGSRVLTGSADGTARVWDAATGAPAGQPLAHPAEVTAVAFRPDGEAVLTGCRDGTTRVWDAARGNLLAGPFGSGGEAVRAVAFRPDGKAFLCAGEDETPGRGLVRLLDPRTGKPLGARSASFAGGVAAAAFSPDGRTVLLGGRDGTARLWDPVTGANVGPVLAHLDRVNAVAFGPGGKTLVTGCSDHTARLWPNPGPVEGAPERVLLWAKIATGLELDVDDRPVPLGAAARENARRRLRVLDLSPSDPDAGAERGRLFAELREWDRAVAEYSRALARRPKDARLWFERGLAQAKLKKWDRAEADLSRALGLRPDDPGWWAERARVYAEQKDWERAAADYTQALRRRADDPDTLTARAHAYTRLGQWDRAAADYARALDLLPADSARWVRGGSTPWARVVAQVIQSDPVFDRTSALRPRDAYLWLARARDSAGHHRWEEAARDYDRAIRLRPDDGRLFFERGLVFAGLGRYEKAGEDLCRALDLSIPDADRDQAYGILAHHDRAFQRSAARRPGDTRLWLERGRALAQEGRWDQVVAVYGLALRPNPDHVNLLVERAAAYVQLRRWDKAAADFAHAIRLLPGDARLYDAVARSDKVFAEVARLRPDDAQLWITRGRDRARLGDWDRAGSDFAKALSLLKDRPAERVGLASELIGWDKALAKTLTLRPDDWVLWHAQGNALARRGDWGKSAAAFARAAKLNPDLAEIGHKEACALLAAGRTGDYRRLCARLLERFGKTQDAANAYWVARAGTLAPDAVAEPARLVALARRALGATPADPETHVVYLRTLAAAHFRAGQFEEAKARLNEGLVEGYPRGSLEAVMDWLWLALTCHRQGQAAQARQDLARFDQLVRNYTQGNPTWENLLASTFSWENKLEYPFLRAEAEALINPYLHWQEKARAHAAKKEWDQAAEAFSRAIRLAPQPDAELYLGRARAYVALRRWDPAAADFARVLEHRTDTQLDEEVARQGPLFSRVVALRPADGLLWVARGTFLGQRALWEEAGAAFAKAVELQPENGTFAWYRHACLRLRLGDDKAYRQACAHLLRDNYAGKANWGQATDVARACMLAPGAVDDLSRVLAFARQAVVGGGSHGWTHYALGTCLYRAGDYRRAVRELEEVVKADPSWKTEMIRWPVLALAHYRLGHKRKARRWLRDTRRWVEQATRDSFSRQTTGPPLLWWDWAEMRMFYREARAVIEGTTPPDDAYDLVFQGRGYAALGKPARAAVCFDRAVELLPKEPQFRLERARFRCQQREWKKAADDFARGLALLADDPEKTDAAYTEAGRWEKVLGPLLRLRPDDGRLHLLRGRTLLLRSRWKEAAAEYARGLETRPHKDEWFEAACLRLLLDDRSGYRRLAARALRGVEATDDPFAAYVAARITAVAPDAPTDPAAAVRAARRAVAGAPRNAWYLHALGLAHLRARDYDRAAERFQESLKSGSWQGEVLNRLGLALVELSRGHEEAARRWLEQADEWCEQKTREAGQDPVAIHPSDWAEFHVLRREAGKLLTKEAPADRKVNSGRTGGPLTVPRR